MFKESLKKKGLARIIAAFWYSLSGLRVAFQSEAAFRQELLLFFLLLPILFYLPAPSIFKALLLCVNTLVLIVELLNSAVEAIVDLASPEFHTLAKQAKDMGSAAVMISLVLALMLWGYVLLAECGAAFPPY
jgi:diacylglycerol kinase (ATP)